jgi:hypothetical protein
VRLAPGAAIAGAFVDAVVSGNDGAALLAEAAQ